MYISKFYDANSYKNGVLKRVPKHEIKSNLYVVVDAESGELLTALHAVSKADAFNLYCDRVKTALAFLGIPCTCSSFNVIVKKVVNET